MHQELPSEKEDRPPVFRSWSSVYAFLLIFQAVLMLLFHLFMHAYS
ncbi:MAG: hypothetical protein ACOYOD_03015 [Saprospiraceae bacterium]